MLNLKLASLLFLAVLAFAFTSMPSAQLGEIAGKVNFSIVKGNSSILYMRVFDNSSSIPINFVVVKPHFQQIAGQTTPALAVSPLNGTIPPGQTISIGITVQMPINVTTGTSWSAIIQVIQVINQSSSGAVANPGVAKIISATALAVPTTTTTSIQQQTQQNASGTQPQVSQVILGGIVLVIVLSGIGYLYLKSTRKKTK